MKTHPAQQFAVGPSIMKGTPLKEIMNGQLVKLIGVSLAEVTPGFDTPTFQKRAKRNLNKLELKERALNIAHAMAEQLPEDFDELAPLLIKSLGPKLQATEQNGLAPFFYFPHSQLIAEYGTDHLESGLKVCYELTQRFTAEFCIRPFLIAHRDKSLKQLKRWTKDANPHVRRLVSEGTRPRLPWAMRLRDFQDDPGYTLPLLESLKDDSELYVRRSVANHLADIAKDHPAVAYEVCHKWLSEIEAMQKPEQIKNRRWVLRHAVRLPAKKEVPAALAIRKAAADRKT